MKALVLDRFGRPAKACPKVEQPAVVGEMDEATVRAAKLGSRLGDLIENQLEPHPGSAQGPKDACYRLLLATEVGDLSDQLGNAGVGGDVRHGTAG